MRNALLFVVAALVLNGCGGPKIATVKGRLTKAGQPFSLPANAGEVFIVFNQLDDAGTPIAFKMYTAVVQSDGSFEVVNSGGELPLGRFQVALDADAKKVPEFAPFLLTVTKTKVEFIAGPNDINIDLSKPGG